MPAADAPQRAMEVAIVGAGLAGLTAAHQLVDAGADVTLFDKGRSVGGRLATRRIGDARLDHGAQFFTVRTPAFQRQVDEWVQREVVRVWNHGFSTSLGHGSADTPDANGDNAGDDNGDGYPRYVGANGMNAMAKDLAVGLSIETSTMVFKINEHPAGSPHRWQVLIDDGTHRDADAVILTCPLPQTFALLIDSGVEMDEALFRTEYDRTIGLLATLDQAPAVPDPGGIQDADEIFSFIGDNAAKGISESPAITMHANPEWSEANWDDDEAALAALIDAAQPWLGDASIIESQLKKWRFATPRTIWPDPVWTAGDNTIVLAGDAFAGPRVEGAHNSGLAAAHTLLA